MPSLDLFQERTNEAGGIYRVANSITAAVDIPTEVFVYTQADDIFFHVATLPDFIYPTVNTPAFEFYRQDNATKDLTDVELALAFANHVKFRLDTLLVAYTDDFNNFPGSETTMFPIP